MEASQRHAGIAAKVGVFTTLALFGIGYIVATLGVQPGGGNAAVLPGRSSQLVAVASLDASAFSAPALVDGEYSLAAAIVVGEQPELLVYNSYTKSNPIQEYGWEYMAEPHRPSAMVLRGWPDPSAEVDYSWVVDGHLQGYGLSCDVTFTATGYHNVTVTAFVPNAEPMDNAGTRTAGGQLRAAVSAQFLREASFNIMVKYVRREIRSLTDSDREAFFNAVAVLQRVPTSVGRSLYGDDYFSKDFLVRIHLYYGGMQGCDHWHQGAGFVTSHMAYTLMFEKALQAVNPSVTVPYWDFTLESTFYSADNWRDSPVFSEDWFGSAAPSNALHAVTAGRFAFAPAMTEARGFSALVNSYGVMRGPWNNDPTPFMTRADSVYGYPQNLKPSGCAEYYRAMRKSSWMALAKQLNSAAHGHIHETVGGAWSHFLRRETGAASPAVYEFVHKMQAMSKELWRTGFLVCPDQCAADVPWRDCQCACNAASLRGLSPFEALREAGVLDLATFYDEKKRPMTPVRDYSGTAAFGFENRTADESAHAYQAMLKLLCAPGHIGDMFQATSPNDITFWVLHPTLDRLWHWKRLTNDPEFDETWVPTNFCYGHDPNDLQPFKNLFDEDGRYYSNRELYGMFDPRNDDLQYVYDNFEWPHCEALGYAMTQRVA